MADLKIRRRVSGKYGGPTKQGQRISAPANTRPSSGTRPGSKSGAPKVAGNIAPAAKTVHSPISDLEEPAPGSEIEPANEPLPEEVTPDFLENAAGVEEDEPKSALDADIDRDADSLDDIAQQEANTSPSDGQDSGQSEDEKSLDEPDEDENLYTGSGKKQLSMRGKLTSVRARIIYAIVTAIATTVAGVLTILPSALVTGVGDLMAKVGDVQVSQQFKYHRKWTFRVKDMFSKDGRRGSALIGEMRAKGYSFQFDDAGNIAGVRKPGSKVFKNAAEDIGSEINDYMDNVIKLGKRRWKDKTSTALYNKFGVKRNSIVSLPKQTDVTPEKQINKELREAASNTEVSVKTERVPVPDDADDADIEKNATDNDTGDAIVSRDGPYEDLAEHLDEGENLSEFTGDPNLRSSLSEVGTNGEGTIKLAKAIDSETSNLSRGFATIKGIGLTTDILDKTCTVYRALKATLILMRTVRSYNLLLSAYRYMTAPDGVRKGEARSDLVREIGKRLITPDFAGQYFGESNGMSSVLYGKFNKKSNDETRTAVAVDGKLSGWQKGAYESTSFANVGGSCALWTNGYTQAGIAAAELTLTIVSFGGIKGAATAAKESFKQAVEKGFTKSIKNALKSRFVRSFAENLLIDLSFNQALIMIKLQQEKMMAGEYTGQDSGGLYSDMLFGGMGVGSRQRSLRAGQVPAFADQYAVVYDQYLAEKKEALQNESVFARYFDVSNTDSLAFKAKMGLAFGASAPSKSIGELSSVALSSPTNIFSTLTRSVTGGASAQGADDEMVAYDTYAFENGQYEGREIAVDFAGNPQTIMPDAIAKIDPVDNLAVLVDEGEITLKAGLTTEEDKLDPVNYDITGEKFLAHIENCVDAMDVISVVEDSDLNHSDPAFDCFAEQPLTQRYKSFLAASDLVNAVDAHVDPESIEDVDGVQNPSTSTTGTGTSSQPINAEGLNGYVIPCEGSPRTVIRSTADSANWDSIPDSGSIGINSRGELIRVYIRDACAGQTDIKTVVIVGSIHGSENGGQLVAHELLFNEDIPDNVRIVAIPEYCSCAGTGIRGNVNGVDLNRNNDFNWNSLPQTQTMDSGLTWSKGTSPASEPETQAINRFLLSLGKTNLSLHYHDSLNYVVGSSQSAVAMASQYANAGGFRNHDDDNRTLIPQRGSLDGWYNQQTGTPTMLIEMGSSQTDEVIKQHVRGVMAVLEGTLL